MVVVARRCRRKRITGGGTTARVGWSTPVWSTRNGKRTGVVEERADARARMREASKGRLERRRGIGRVRAEAPVTARYGSLSDRCRYRVAVSSESDLLLHHFSLALVDLGEWKVVPLSPSLPGRASRQLDRRRAHDIIIGDEGRPR